MFRTLTQFLLILLSSALLASPFAVPAVWAADQVRSDIRVVIDVSGSMKQNDPRNLRRPALKLLVGLLPDGTRAGVWTFGQYVNMQVPLADVDEKWKSRARREAEKIHSPGLYTNIEEALKKASAGWQQPDPRYRRHLILLTDGMVDISKQPEKNAASRQRILTDILPRLNQAEVRIHSIALSEGVDRDLLNTLSAYTEGGYEQAESADDLQRIFLRLFEKSAPVQNLPLEANRFRVDANIKDMTLLVFRQPNRAPLIVITPDQQRWQAEQYDKKSVRWYPEQAYDLITVKQPQAGEWQLLTAEDPGNRVMVVTNLELQVSPVPDHILADDQFLLSASLQEDNRPVTRTDFLQLVNFELLALGGLPRPAQTLRDDGMAGDETAQDGRYALQLTGASLGEGEKSLVVRAHSQTFEREYRYPVRVYPAPFQVDITEQSGDTGHYLIKLKIPAGLFRPDSVTLNALTDRQTAVQFTRDEQHTWTATVSRDEQPASVTIQLQAMRADGQNYAYESSITLPGQTIPTSTQQGAAQQPQSEPPQATQVSEVDEAHAGTTEEGNWLLITLVVVMVNLVLIGLGIAGYLLFRKKRALAQSKQQEDIAL